MSKITIVNLQQPTEVVVKAGGAEVARYFLPLNAQAVIDTSTAGVAAAAAVAREWTVDVIVEGSRAKSLTVSDPDAEVTLMRMGEGVHLAAR